MELYKVCLISLIIIAMACSSPATIQEDWSNPEQKKDSTKVFQKILFAVLLKNDAARKIAEDKLVAEVKGRGVASYAYLRGINTKPDENLLSEKLKHDGFDGVVVMRLITIDKNVTHLPGTYPAYYNSWYGYYSSSFPGFNEPGNNSSPKGYNVETNVYSLNTGKLLWTGITSAVNISDTEKMIDKIIALIKQKMKSQGLIK